jgi:hypothetical protein
MSHWHLALNTYFNFSLSSLGSIVCYTHPLALIWPCNLGYFFIPQRNELSSREVWRIIPAQRISTTKPEQINKELKFLIRIWLPSFPAGLWEAGIVQSLRFSPTTKEGPRRGRRLPFINLCLALCQVSSFYPPGKRTPIPQKREGNSSKELNNFCQLLHD